MRSSRPHPFWPFFKGVFFTIVLLVLLAMCSCTTEPSRELGWTVDQSHSQINLHRDSTERMHRFLEEDLLNMTDKPAYSGGIKLYLCAMGSSARPQVAIIELKPGKHWLLETRKKREAKVQEFRAKLRSALDNLASAPLDQPTSHLHHAICYVSDLMAQSNFSSDKQIYCFSDGLENSNLANFSRYTNHPDSFEQDFETLSQRFNQSCPLPEMAEVQFFLLNSPKDGMNELVLKSGAFWKHHLEKAGAAFRVRSNLSF